MEEKPDRLSGSEVLDGAYPDQPFQRRGCVTGRNPSQHHIEQHWERLPHGVTHGIAERVPFLQQMTGSFGRVRLGGNPQPRVEKGAALEGGWGRHAFL